MLAYVLGYTLTTIIFEGILWSDFFGKDDLINYSGKSRKASLHIAASKIPLKIQISQVLWVLIGPTAFINGIFGIILFDMIDKRDSLVEAYHQFPTLVQFLYQILAMQVIGDFFLYW